MRARDVMVRAVVTASPETTVEELARLMVNRLLRPHNRLPDLCVEWLCLQ
jgi:CBS domain-containing protein